MSLGEYRCLGSVRCSCDVLTMASVQHRDTIGNFESRECSPRYLVCMPLTNTTSFFIRRPEIRNVRAWGMVEYVVRGISNADDLSVMKK